MILISVQNAAKSFGIHQVLADVSFSLQKGEKMGLVGVNGSGKTTLLRLITGQEQPDSGAIHLSKDPRLSPAAREWCPLALVARRRRRMSHVSY
jgi:ATP-binding cassette subfamily F protein 3